MLTNIYSIHDSKGSIFNTPFFAINDSMATRNFLMLKNDSKSTVSQFPDDFALYKIGSYDDSTGLITPVNVPERLGGE